MQIAGAGKRPVLYCRDFKLGARHSTLQAQVDLDRRLLSYGSPPPPARSRGRRGVESLAQAVVVFHEPRARACPWSPAVQHHGL